MKEKIDSQNPIIILRYDNIQRGFSFSRRCKMLRYILGGFIIFSSIILLYQLAIRHIIQSISKIIDDKLSSTNLKNVKYRTTK